MQVELAAQLADMNHLVSSLPDDVLRTLLAMDLDALEPYTTGDASQLVAQIDKIMGFA